MPKTSFCKNSEALVNELIPQLVKEMGQ